MALKGHSGYPAVACPSVSRGPRRRFLCCGGWQVGHQLAHQYGTQARRIAAALATHFERGREYARAVEYLIQAADVATFPFLIRVIFVRYL